MKYHESKNKTKRGGLYTHTHTHTHTQQNPRLTRLLSMLVFWIAMSGVGYGQLIINSSNSPAVWSDDPANPTTLTAIEIANAQSAGIVIQSGGTLTVINSTSQYLVKDVVINSGGSLLVKDGSINCGLCIEGSLEVNGTCIARDFGEISVTQNSLSNNGKVSLSGSISVDNLGRLKLNTGVDLDVFITGVMTASRSSSAGRITMSSGSNTSIEGIVNADGGSVTLNTTVVKNLGSIRSVNNGHLEFTGDLEIRDDAFIRANSGKIDFYDQVQVNTGTQLIGLNNSTITVKDPNANVIINDGIIRLSGSKIVCEEIRISGLLEMEPSSECKVKDDGLVSVLSAGKIECQNSKFVMGNNSKIDCFGHIQAFISGFESSTTGGTWFGIHSDFLYGGGNSVQSQYVVSPSIDNSGNCTKEEWSGVLGEDPLIELTNSYIRNAEIGVFSNGELLQSKPAKYKGGTVVRCINTSFFNCNRGVVISNFSNPNGEVNASYLMKCEFNTDNEYLATGFPQIGMAHIELSRLGKSGVRIGGCIFSNSISSPQPSPERGTGILIYNSLFSVGKDGDKCCSGEEPGSCPEVCYEDGGDSRRNTFNNLSYGIRIDQSKNEEYASKIRFSDFNHCYRSVDGLNLEQAVINNNNFTLTQNDYASNFTDPNPASGLNARHFIKLKSSGGYVIAKCTMNTVLNPGANRLEYLNLDNSSANVPTYNSKVKDNVFENNKQGFAIGIQLLGSSRGNDITCNEFKDLSRDISILTTGVPAGQYLGTIPKDVTKYSNNSFSDPAGNPNWDYNVTTDGLLTVYYKPDPLVPTPIGNSSVQMNGNKNDGINCGFKCAENENTETASIDEEHLGLSSWLYSIDDNTIAIGSRALSNYDICIFTMFGQCAISLDNIQTNESIDISSLSSGVYYLSVLDLNGVKNTLKFIKK